MNSWISTALTTKRTSASTRIMNKHGKNASAAFRLRSLNSVEPGYLPSNRLKMTLARLVLSR